MQRRGFSLIDQNCRNKRGFWTWDILGYLYNTLSTAFYYEASFLGFWNVTQWQSMYCRVQRRGFSLIDQKCRIYGDLNWDKFEMIWDICTAQKNYAYIVTLWWLGCVDQYFRATVLERRCEKGVVRKTLWERRCKKFAVRKIFLLTCFFYSFIMMPMF